MNRKIRQEVFERERVCRKCGTSGTRDNPLTIHHIKPKADYPELVNDPENLAVLCSECHRKVHGIGRENEGGTNRASFPALQTSRRGKKRRRPHRGCGVSTSRGVRK